MTTQTPRTDAYEKEYLAWQEYAKQYGHLSEAMEQCPLEDDPIGMMRKFERELATVNVRLAGLRELVKAYLNHVTKYSTQRPPVERALREELEKNDGPRT